MREKKKMNSARNTRSDRGRTGKRPAFVILRVFIWISLTAAAALFAGPSFFDARANMTQIQKITGYAKTVDAMTDEKAEKEKQEAEAYNLRIRNEQEGQIFRYRGEAATDDDYEKQLSEDAGGVMGYLEIPKLRLYLPISHGTKSDELEYECGHMYGTSLPVGGESAHAVIAGHTGLPTADLFTHLTDLVAGDEFRIHVLGEIHAYTVRNIRIVLPEEEAAYLQVEDGQDLVTLYTCTPYGINDHRLLVEGERTYPDPVREQEGTTETMIVEQRNREAIIKTGVFAAIPVCVLLLGAFDLIRTLSGKKKAEKRKENTKGSPRAGRAGHVISPQEIRIRCGHGYTWNGTYERRST